VRRSIARTIARDATALRARGVRVRVIEPQPEDLAVMGLNLMNAAPRRDVLETARRTAAEQLRRQRIVTGDSDRAGRRASGGSA
jgi:NTE family protein